MQTKGVQESTETFHTEKNSENEKKKNNNEINGWPS